MRNPKAKSFPSVQRQGKECNSGQSGFWAKSDIGKNRKREKESRLWQKKEN